MLSTADNLDNAASVVLNVPDESFTAVSNGSTWRIISRTQTTGSLLAIKASVSLTNTTAKITSWTNSILSGGAITFDAGYDRFTINKSGIYELSVYFEATGTTATQGMGYKINGSTFQSVAKNSGWTGSYSTDHNVGSTTLISLAAGDYIEFFYSASASKTASNARMALTLRN